MKRLIFCTFLKKYSEAQEYQIYPGIIGERIYKEISQDAWNQWLIKQTILINEKQLNMLHLEHRKILEQEMINFLFKT